MSFPGPLTHCAFPALPPPIPIPMMELPDPQCGYLPDRSTMTRAFGVREMPGELYHDFMDAGFRRSGRILYQPACHGCRLCVPIRVPVERFQPGKSQRRVSRRNSDLRVEVGEPAATEEKFELYGRYLATRHASGRMERKWEAFEEFLYTSPVDTIECVYRDSAGRLLAVGICDLCSRSLSTVYVYFDPGESRRSLGTYSALFEIELARKLRIPYYYLGYWIAGCQAMEYKATYRPCEVLDPDGVWRTKEQDRVAAHGDD